VTAAEYASVRDIPRSCTCTWHYAARTSRWVLARPDPECPWHLHQRALAYVPGDAP
jgi:hypothetical protein